MSYLWLGLWIYFCIGLMVSIGLLNYADKIIGKYEDGEELEDDDKERVEETGKMIRFLGGKGYIAFLMIVTMIFWLPMFIFDPKRHS